VLTKLISIKMNFFKKKSTAGDKGKNNQGDSESLEVRYKK
jgi:hypothetical protein